MAGFGRFSLIGEYFGNPIVNVLWYRSVDWLPFGGNPFADIGHAIDSLDAHITTAFLACLSSNYTLLRWEAGGYDDQFRNVTSSPVAKTKNLPGALGAPATSGAVLTMDVRFVLGAQHQINGSGQSARNRGYVALGPVNEDRVDNYGHLDTDFITTYVGALAALLDDTVADIGGLTSLIPIRVHHKKLGPVLLWRTYSDITGYVLPRIPGVRRSRLPRA